MSLSRPDPPTLCLHCGYSNGGRFIRCPCCKRPTPEWCDRLVGITSIALAAYSIVTGIL